MSKRAYDYDKKVEIVLKHVDEGVSLSQLAELYSASGKTISHWVHLYQQDGLEALKESTTWKRYPQELKLQAIHEVLEGSSILSVSLKYKISNDSVLKNWIIQYTNGEKISSTSKGLSTMNKGRKTSLNERIEIVNYTLACDKNYQAAMDKFNVSYQQVYNWVRKFEKDGINGLQDRRGKGLESKVNLTEVEKLKLEVKRLKARNAHLEMEIGIEKKLQEIMARYRK